MIWLEYGKLEGKGIEIFTSDADSYHVTTVALVKDYILLGTDDGGVLRVALDGFEDMSVKFQEEFYPLSPGSTDVQRLSFPSLRSDSVVRKILPVGDCWLSILTDTELIIADRCDPYSRDDESQWPERYVKQFDIDSYMVGKRNMAVWANEEQRCCVAIFDMVDKSLLTVSAPVSCSEVMSSSLTFDEWKFTVKIDRSLVITPLSFVSGMAMITAFVPRVMILSVDSSQLCILIPYENGNKDFVLALVKDYSPLNIGDVREVYPADIATPLGVFSEFGTVDEKLQLFNRDLFPLATSSLIVSDTNWQAQHWRLAALGNKQSQRQSVYLTTVPMVDVEKQSVGSILAASVSAAGRRLRRRLFGERRVGGGFLHDQGGIRIVREQKRLKKKKEPSSNNNAEDGKITIKKVMPSECAPLMTGSEKQLEGPYPPACLSYLWQSVGCKLQGALNPVRNLKWAGILATYSWTEVQKLFKGIAQRSNHEKKQLDKVACLSDRLCEYAVVDLTNTPNIICSIDGDLYMFQNGKGDMLGTGGQGAVKKAVRIHYKISEADDEPLLEVVKSDVVAKFYENSILNHDSFFREASAMASLSASSRKLNVPPIIGYTRNEVVRMRIISQKQAEPRFLVIVMQHLPESTDLTKFGKSYFVQSKLQQAHLPAIVVAVRLLVDMAPIFEKMEELSWSHADTKPGNVIATNTLSRKLSFYLIDFGMVWRQDIEFLTGGTLLYMSPEQYRLLYDDEENSIVHRRRCVDAYSVFLTVAELYGQLCVVDDAPDSDLCQACRKLLEIRVSPQSFDIEYLWQERSKAMHNYAAAVNQRDKQGTNYIEQFGMLLYSVIARTQVPGESITFSHPVSCVSWHKVKKKAIDIHDALTM